MAKTSGKAAVLSRFVLCLAPLLTATAFAQDGGPVKLPPTGDEILIVRDDFGANFVDASTWHITNNAGARVEIAPSLEALTIVTEPNSAGPGAASVNGTKSFPIGTGKLIFKAREWVYRDHTLYGDYQPRGLVAGTDRDNAIEFVSSLTDFPFGVDCRTVSNGHVTQTHVNIGQDVETYNLYQIVATANRVDFYINGKRVSTHTTNIPTVPLNPYFSSSDGGFGNVPIAVDWVSFSRM
jgi:hypothetical protein